MSFCNRGCGTGFNSKIERECHEDTCGHEKYLIRPIECYATVHFNEGGSMKETITGYYETEDEAIGGGGCNLRRIIRLVETTPKKGV